MATCNPGPLRSWLFAPGSNMRIMDKAVTSSADCVILDLEDAVSLAEKSSARALVAEVLRTRDRANLYVRINALSTAFAYDDVLACVSPYLAGMMLPKAETARDIAVLDWLLLQQERSLGLGEGAIGIVPLLETAKGIADAAAIATASARVRQLAFGAGDFTLELNMVWSRDEAELIASRHSIVLSSACAGLLPPIDAAWVDISDGEGMALSARRARDHGFQGKLCIHPAQVAAVHAAYTPGRADVARAERVVAAFEEAIASGAASIQVDGRMIDYPIVEIARRTLADATRAGN